MSYFTSNTPEELLKEYRLLAKEFHPDNIKTGNEKKFKEIAEEYIQKKNRVTKETPIDFNEMSRIASNLMEDLLDGAGFAGFRFFLRGPELDFIISSRNNIKDIEAMLKYVKQVQNHGFTIHSVLEYEDSLLFIVPMNYGICIMKNPAQRVPAPTSTKIFKNYVVTTCGKISVGTNITNKKLIYIERSVDDLITLIRQKPLRAKN